MNLKNRFAAIATVAAIAIPAVAFAAKWNLDTGKDKPSVVTVKVKAGPAGVIKFDARAMNDAITMEERGDSTVVKIDGHRMHTGKPEDREDMKERNGHMRTHVFNKSKHVELVALNKDIEAAKSSGKLPIKVTFGGKTIDKVVTEFKVAGGAAKGKFVITTLELGLGDKEGKICKPAIGGLKFTDVCVKPELEVIGTLFVKN